MLWKKNRQALRVYSKGSTIQIGGEGSVKEIPYEEKALKWDLKEE